MRLLAFFFFLLTGLLPLVAQTNGIDQASDLVTVGSNKFLRWYGHSDRSYFVQVSDPNDHLKKWAWAPIIESGNNEDISYEVDGTADKGFFRLKFTNQIPGGNETLETADFDDDGLSNWDEITVYFTDPLDGDTDGDGMPDYYEITHYLDPNYDEGGYDYDGDGLTNIQEYHAGTEPYARDTDGDGMDDGFEVAHSLDPLDATDAASDADGDGLSNLWEFKLGLNPRLTDSDGNGVSDPQEDRDQDGLTNIFEINIHGTDPTQPDTDGDGLNDGWEILYGYSALINNETDADPNNDPDADPDNDGLINSAEEQIGTNPNTADTDGDGFSDLVEEQSASSPTNPASTPSNPGGTPGGPPSPPPPTIPVQVNFGDHSESHSEKYKVWLEPLEGDANTQKRYRTNRKYGQTQTETFHLPAGAKYKITLTHIGTDPNYHDDPKPDYDYTLEFTSNSTVAAIKAIPEDSAGMLGVHDESEDFFAKGKDATLYIAWMTSETVATQPPDRERLKVGVAEEVQLTLKPSSLPAPTWALSGTPGTSALDSTTGVTSKLTAGDVACAPKTEATINGTVLKLDFSVIPPDTVTFTKNATTSQITPSLGIGFTANVFIGPADVSFRFITVEEEQCNAVAVDYFAYQNNMIHPASQSPISMTSTVDSIKGTQMVGGDTIIGGTQGPTYSSGTFTWPIPWKYTANGQKHPIGSGPVIHYKTITITNNKATLSLFKNGANDSISEP